MVNILLACAAGMSTSLLVTKMKKYVQAQGKDYKIWATDIDSIDDEDEKFDIVLIGPQVAWRIDKVKETVGDKIPVAVIDKNEYGKCNGEAVVKMAEELLHIN